MRSLIRTLLLAACVIVGQGTAQADPRDYRIVFDDGVESALDASRITDGRNVGTVRATLDGQDIAHDITFAFAAHAFHPQAGMVDE